MKKRIQNTFSYSEILQESLDFGLEYLGQGSTMDFLGVKDESELDVWALALIDEDGHIYKAGNAEQRFSMQSISKVLTFLILLEHKPLDEIVKTIDIKPTALPYNSIIDLELGQRKPRNPMVSIGAVATIALLSEIYQDKTFEFILNHLKEITGNAELDYSKEIFLPELSGGYTNFSGINLMIQAGTLSKETDIKKVIETYYKCCTIMVNTVEMARLAHLLSNDGYSISKGAQLYRRENIQILRSIMAHSGMYDHSGEFAALVGLPAKSGVGGGVIACTRCQLGLAAFSPRLDEAGNSIVAVKSLEYLSDKLNLSIY
ncbi:MAG TPA: glutaminase A [Erysipelotrichaceae bacterium]|nr:glutaminase A [Erysipelotrichaceae bacterium]